MEYFGKVVPYLLTLKLNGTKALYSWSIDKISSPTLLTKWYHTGAGGSVHLGYVPPILQRLPK